MKFSIALLLVSLSFFCNCQSTEQSSINRIEDSYYREIKASHFIAPELISLEDEVINNLMTRGLILELVSNTEDPSKVERKWNKYYYEDLPYHYSDSEGLNLGAQFLGITGESSLDIINNWPGKLTDQEYDYLYREMKIDLVNRFELPEFMRGKYIITPNQKFWDFTKDTGYPLLVDILDTNGREFETYELVHDNLNSALDFAVLIFDALCNQRDPDNSYYYNQITLDQFPSLPENLRNEFTKLELSRYNGLPIYNMNYFTKNKMVEYNNIFRREKKNLEISKRIFTNLPTPPFFITKVLQ